LTIREFQLADAEALFSLQSDPRATRYAGGTRTKRQSQESLYRIINRVRKYGFGTFAVQLSAGGPAIGWAGIQKVLDAERYELLYALRSEYWGRGYATEAGRVLLGAAFSLEGAGPQEIFGLVFPQNVPSIRVLENLGFLFVEYHFDEMTRRHACLYRTTRARFLAIQSHQVSSKK
jgi:RimJ/RimL family protein N-acetyltransferase